MAHASPERSDGLSDGVPHQVTFAPERPGAIACIDLSDGVPHQVTLAPERPGAIACIKELVAQGVIVSAGHSNASADQVRWPRIDGRSGEMALGLMGDQVRWPSD